MSIDKIPNWEASNMTEVKVCIGSACHLRGSYNVIQTFQQLVEAHGLHDKIEIKAQFCMKRCDHEGICISIDGMTQNILPENPREFFKTSLLV